MIKVKFQATDIFDLREQMLAMAGAIQTEVKVATEHEKEIVEGMYETETVASPLPSQPSAPPPPIMVTPQPAPSVVEEHAPEAVVQNSTASGVKDSRGFTWDERIHSGSQAFNADGTWRARRGVKPEMVSMIEAQLRGSATLGQPGVPHAGNVINLPPVTPPPPQVTVPVEMPYSQPAQPVAQVQSMAPVQPSYDNIQIPQVVKPAHNLATFKANLIPLLAHLTQEGKITTEYLETLKNYFGVTQIWDVAKDDTKSQTLMEVFAEAKFITVV